MANSASEVVSFSENLAKPIGDEYTDDRYWSSKIWYENLSKEAKKETLMRAINIFPYLKNHMKSAGVRAGDPNFTSHSIFKLMVDVLHGR